MCWHGTHRKVKIINTEQKHNCVPVDACIAEEVQFLNDKGVITLGCCCGHGKAGQIVEIENGYGKWLERTQPPTVLIESGSVLLAKRLGYNPYPYYYANGEHHDVWKMQLKTGCITEKDCEQWQKQNNDDDNIIAGSL